MQMRTRGDVPSVARLLHYYCCACRPMRARRPEVAVNSYAGPITRLPAAHASHPREISSAVYHATRAFVRVQLPYSRASWVVTVTPPRRVVGRPRVRALTAQVWRVPRRLSGIDRPPPHPP